MAHGRNSSCFCFTCSSFFFIMEKEWAQYCQSSSLLFIFNQKEKEKEKKKKFKFIGISI